MNKTFESFNELYAFFVPNLIKPKTKNKYIYLIGTQLDRSGWHLHIVQNTPEAIQLKFAPYPYGHAKWVFHAQKYTNTSQNS